MKVSVVVCLLSALCLVAYIEAENLARGWNDKIQWRTLNDALVEAKQENKPIMLVIHKTWCGACKNLKPKFAASQEIEELSKQFVMVNAQDDEEPSDDQFKPDGGYIPRILFLSPDGKVRPDLQNKFGNPQYKYYYADANSVVQGMKDAIAAFNTAVDADGAPIRSEL